MTQVIRKINCLYFLLFRKSSELQLLIQKYENDSKLGGDNNNINSYIGLKKYQKKLRVFLVLFFVGTVIFGVGVFVSLLLLLNFLLNTMGVADHPFNFF
jgi:hypothetical protein